MKFVCSLITVSDISQSRDFYERILGQKVRHDFGENVFFEAGFSIHLRSHFSSLIGGRTIVQGENSFELYFEQEDLETCISLLEREGIELIHGIHEQPWKQRVVRFYDPDRVVIEVGEPMESVCRRLVYEGFSVERIVADTGLDERFVRESLLLRDGAVSD